jgi:hypothetical protein
MAGPGPAMTKDCPARMNLARALQMLRDKALENP